MFLEVVLLPQYIAPFVAALYAIGLQCMRHLRFFKAEGRPAGRWMVRLLVLVCIAMACIRADQGQLHLGLGNWPSGEWTANWFGTEPFGAQRAAVEESLENQPGKQLVIVRYSPQHESVFEWVYNKPDVDNAKVIWAREMSSAENLELIRYYHDRKVWLVQPDSDRPSVTPYENSESAVLPPGISH
jgi:hypothetical protein